MIVDPVIAALRHDSAPQRRAQERLEGAHAAWRADHRVAEVESELAAFAAGEDCAALPHLGALFQSGRAASAFVDDFVRASCTALRKEPLSQIGLRHYLDDRTASLMLARHGTATLTLQVFDGAVLAQLPPPDSAIFTPTESIEAVLAGSAAARVVTIEGDRGARALLSCREVELAQGDVLYRHGSRQALQLGGFAGCLLMLKLQRRLPGNHPSRAFRMADGQLVSQAAGRPRDSRIELAIALLGRMGRCDSASLLAAVAEEDGGDSMRWQALRECLALDSGTGFRTLCRIAADAGDPLAPPAGALRGQLLEAWPQLSAIEPCPAS